jgi:hypothetical protein
MAQSINDDADPLSFSQGTNGQLCIPRQPNWNDSLLVFPFFISPKYFMEQWSYYGLNVSANRPPP